MVDIGKFPAHVQAAIQAIGLVHHALERAQAGAKWLDEYGPADWRLQMISIHQGKVTSHVRLCRNDENPLALASLFGWRILWRYALGRLTIPQAEARASYVIGAKVRAIVSPYAEIGINVDRVSDIALAEKYTG